MYRSSVDFIDLLPPVLQYIHTLIEACEVAALTTSKQPTTKGERRCRLTTLMCRDRDGNLSALLQPERHSKQLRTTL